MVSSCIFFLSTPQSGYAVDVGKVRVRLVLVVSWYFQISTPQSGYAVGVEKVRALLFPIVFLCIFRISIPQSGSKVDVGKIPRAAPQWLLEKSGPSAGSCEVP